jgi:hypothetical protein
MEVNITKEIEKDLKLEDLSIFKYGSNDISRCRMKFFRHYKN